MLQIPQAFKDDSIRISRIAWLEHIWRCGTQNLQISQTAIKASLSSPVKETSMEGKIPKHRPSGLSEIHQSFYPKAFAIIKVWEKPTGKGISVFHIYVMHT